MYVCLLCLSNYFDTSLCVDCRYFFICVYGLRCLYIYLCFCLSNVLMPWCLSLSVLIYLVYVFLPLFMCLCLRVFLLYECIVAFGLHDINVFRLYDCVFSECVRLLFFCMSSWLVALPFNMCVDVFLSVWIALLSSVVDVFRVCLMYVVRYVVCMSSCSVFMYWLSYCLARYCFMCLCACLMPVAVYISVFVVCMSSCFM